MGLSLVAMVIKNRHLAGAVFFLSCLGVLSCSSVPLLDSDLRMSEFVSDVTVNSRIAYLRALHWLDRKLPSEPGTSRSQLMPEGKIQLKSRVECDLLEAKRGATSGDDEGEFPVPFLRFDLGLSFRGKSVEMRFEDLRIVDREGTLVRDPERQLTSGARFERVQPCLTKLRDALVRGIEIESANE